MLRARSIRPLSLLLAAVALPLLLAGCFETTLNLGAAADSKADSRYCGSWHFADKEGDSSPAGDLLTRNFDGRHFYAEWTSHKDGKTEVLRLSAFLVPIKDTTFAQLSPM